MNVYQKYPELYEFVLRNAESDVTKLFVCIMYLTVVYMLGMHILRTCVDPLSIRLTSRVADLENKLSEADDLFAVLYRENEANEAKIVDLHTNLEAAQYELANMKLQYMYCRGAAQKFLEATCPEEDTQG